jgi:hypothetical protein
MKMNQERREARREIREADSPMERHKIRKEQGRSIARAAKPRARFVAPPGRTNGST